MCLDYFELRRRKPSNPRTTPNHPNVVPEDCPFEEQDAPPIKSSVSKTAQSSATEGAALNSTSVPLPSASEILGSVPSIWNLYQNRYSLLSALQMPINCDHANLDLFVKNKSTSSL